jgi:hypothetical protein
MKSSVEIFLTTTMQVTTIKNLKSTMYLLENHSLTYKSPMLTYAVG